MCTQIAWMNTDATSTEIQTYILNNAEDIFYSQWYNSWWILISLTIHIESQEITAHNVAVHNKKKLIPKLESKDKRTKQTDNIKKNRNRVTVVMLIAITDISYSRAQRNITDFENFSFWMPWHLYNYEASKCGHMDTKNYSYCIPWNKTMFCIVIYCVIKYP